MKLQKCDDRNWLSFDYFVKRQKLEVSFLGGRRVQIAFLLKS
jgi:hypothetical protein